MPPKARWDQELAWKALFYASRWWATRHLDQWDQYKFLTKYGFVYVHVGRSDPYASSYGEVDHRGSPVLKASRQVTQADIDRFKAEQHAANAPKAQFLVSALTIFHPVTEQLVASIDLDAEQDAAIRSTLPTEGAQEGHQYGEYEVGSVFYGQSLVEERPKGAEPDPSDERAKYLLKALVEAAVPLEALLLSGSSRLHSPHMQRGIAEGVEAIRAAVLRYVPKTTTDNV